MRGDRLALTAGILVVALVAVAAVVGWAAGHYTNRTKTIGSATTSAAGAVGTSVDPKVAAGAHDVRPVRLRPVPRLQRRRRRLPGVPALTSAGKPLTVGAAAHIINHGLGESANPKKPYMPVWGAVISKRQVSDLVAYIRAGLPERADGDAAGGAAATKGAAGRGRGALRARRLHQLPWPERPRRRARTRSRRTRRSRRSPEPTSGSEFNTDEKIKDVIRSGSVIGRAPIVSMPHWGGILSDADLSALVAYLKTLK